MSAAWLIICFQIENYFLNLYYILYDLGFLEKHFTR